MEAFEKVVHESMGVEFEVTTEVATRRAERRQRSTFLFQDRTGRVEDALSPQPTLAVIFFPLFILSHFRPSTEGHLRVSVCQDLGV